MEVLDVERKKLLVQKKHEQYIRCGKQLCKRGPFEFVRITQNHRSLLAPTQQLRDDVLGKWTSSQLHVIYKNRNMQLLNERTHE